MSDKPGKTKKSVAAIIAAAAAAAAAGQTYFPDPPRETTTQTEKRSKERDRRLDQDKEGFDPSKVREQGDRLCRVLKEELRVAEHRRSIGLKVDEQHMNLLRSLIAKWAELAGELEDAGRRKDKRRDDALEARDWVRFMQMITDLPGE